MRQASNLPKPLIKGKPRPLDDTAATLSLAYARRGTKRLGLSYRSMADVPVLMTFVQKLLFVSQSLEYVKCVTHAKEGANVAVAA